MMDVPLIVTVECRAFAYLTPTRDRISPIRTGRRATTLVPRRLRSAVAGEQASGPILPTASSLRMPLSDRQVNVKRKGRRDGATRRPRAAAIERGFEADAQPVGMVRVLISDRL